MQSPNTQIAMAWREVCTHFCYADITYCKTGVLFISRCQNIPSVYFILSFFEIGFSWVGFLCGSSYCFDVRKRIRMGKVERASKMQCIEKNSTTKRENSLVFLSSAKFCFIFLIPDQ